MLKASEFNISGAVRDGWFQDINKILFPAESDTKAMVAFVDQSKAAAKKWLPLFIRQAVESLNNASFPAALVIRNLPVDTELPSPPADGFRPASKLKAVSEAVLLGVSSLYGVPFTYEQEKQGRMPADVIPIVGLENTQSNASRGEFLPHGDNHFFKRDFVPEALFLLGLVDSAALTKVISAEVISAHLTPESRAMLQQPLYRVQVPESFDLGGYDVWSPSRPLLWEEDGCTCLTTTSKGGVRPTTVEAERAYAEYSEILESMSGEPVNVGRGVLLGFSNLRNLHARTQFEGPRWLQRCYARKHVDALRRAGNADAWAYAFDTRTLLK